jgi:hypothetical protein
MGRRGLRPRRLGPSTTTCHRSWRRFGCPSSVRCRRGSVARSARRCARAWSTSCRDRSAGRVWIEAGFDLRSGRVVIAEVVDADARAIVSVGQGSFVGEGVRRVALVGCSGTSHFSVTGWNTLANDSDSDHTSTVTASPSTGPSGGTRRARRPLPPPSPTSSVCASTAACPRSTPTGCGRCDASPGSRTGHADATVGLGHHAGGQGLTVDEPRAGGLVGADGLVQRVVPPGQLRLGRPCS